MFVRLMRNSLIILLMTCAFAIDAADLSITTATQTLSAYLVVDSANRLLFTGTGSTTPTLNGNGHTISFAPQFGTGLIVVSANRTARFTNTRLYKFDPSYVVLNTGSALQFLDGCTIDLARSVDLSSTWSFAAGSCLIRGHGCTLNLVANPSIVVFPRTTLRFQDINLTSVSGTASADATGNRSSTAAYIRSTPDIRCRDYSSNIEFRNCNIEFSGNFSFTVGNIFINDVVRFRGDGVIFAYSSTGNLRINSNATLLIDYNMNFSYDSADSTVNAKNHIVFADAKARLLLNGCTLHTTWTGLSLSTGIVSLQDKVLFQTEARNNAEAISLNSSNLNLEILGGSLLDVDGIVFYQ